ncbi:MAG: FecR domain-containing protein, partial [Spirochaetes bacterium]|nr:FecR domain-containing protein [Spirochaetota bacterium]
MEKIDQLIDRLDNTKVEISDAIYENIHRGIESIRRQRKKRIFPQISRKVYIRYALTFAILFIIGITYFFSSGVLVRVVQKKGYMVVVRGKGIRERLIDGRIRSFSDRKLETGRDSSILLQYGKHLTVELRGENRIKTGKIKRLFGYERYEFYLSKGDQTYTIVHGDPQLFILTEEVELRHIGTRFNISADMRGTCIKVLEGEVAIKRNIKNKGKIEMFQYEKGSYEKELKSVMNKEVNIKRGGAVRIERETDKEIERIIDEVISEKKRVNEEIMNRIRRKMVIEKKTEG